jgi:hypothetical protein
MDACYFPFQLLASGQSVFFIPDGMWIYYFSAVGVQQALDGAADMGTAMAAVERGWVIINVDLRLDWLPSAWAYPVYWPGEDIDADGPPPAPLYQAHEGEFVVHEVLVFGRDQCGRVSLVSNGTPSMLTPPNKHAGQTGS